MKIRKIVTVSICFLLVAFIVLQQSSFQLALSFAGLSSKQIQYVEKLDEDQTIFKVFQTTTKEGELALVRTEKNDLGFWQVVDIETPTEEDPFINMAWIGSATMRRYDEAAIGIREREYHFAYCGNDAIKTVELHEHQLPKNAAVNIQQAGEFYLIHIIAFASEEFALSIRSALEENGCVPPTVTQ